MSAIHNVEIDGEIKEVVAYGDVYEYVEDGDFTYYAWTRPYEGDYIALPAKPIDDPDFFVAGEPVVLNDGHTYIPVNFGEDDDRVHVIDENGLHDEIYLIYVWNDGEYVAFNGVAYPTEKDAIEKIKEQVRDLFEHYYTFPYEEEAKTAADSIDHLLDHGPLNGDDIDKLVEQFKIEIQDRHGDLGEETDTPQPSSNPGNEMRHKPPKRGCSLEKVNLEDYVDKNWS